MALYEFVVIEKPTARDGDKGELERVIHGPRLIPANDEQHARTLALLDFKLPDDVVKRRVEVLVRAFADAS